MWLSRRVKRDSRIEGAKRVCLFSRQKVKKKGVDQQSASKTQAGF